MLVAALEPLHPPQQDDVEEIPQERDDLADLADQQELREAALQAGEFGIDSHDASGSLSGWSYSSRRRGSKGNSRSRIFFAGTPPKMLPSGTSPVTTEPALTITSEPMVVPGVITARAPSQTFGSDGDRLQVCAAVEFLAAVVAGQDQAAGADHHVVADGHATAGKNHRAVVQHDVVAERDPLRMGDLDAGAQRDVVAMGLEFAQQTLTPGRIGHGGQADERPAQDAGGEAMKCSA